jgi:acetylornithine deacetylase
MDLFELTKALVNINSVTGGEAACAGFLHEYLGGIGLDVEMQPVAGERCNVFGTRGKPRVVLSTHMDTVPPFFEAREDADFIYGRGSCDAKGIIAAQVAAAERLLHEKRRDFGLLFLAGEETTSDGAHAANLIPRGSEYMVNGEPTDNRLAVGSKGNLWFKVEVKGRAAHSAYPDLGDPAIEKLIDLLVEVRRLPLPYDPVFGAATLNIGLISGGRAANVIPDHAEAQILFRSIPEAPGVTGLRTRVERLLHGRCTVTLIRDTPPLQMEALEGYETQMVSFTTDLPSLTNWGRPLLIGPGSIHEAHTENEKVPKAELLKAVDIYCGLVRDLSARSRG